MHVIGADGEKEKKKKKRCAASYVEGCSGMPGHPHIVLIYGVEMGICGEPRHMGIK
jgi:hypothetical protein